MKNLIQKWNSINLIKRIICGLIVGIILGLAIPQASVISILGDLFVGALRGIAPGVLPGNELSVPHGKRPENKHEIRCCTLSSGKYTLSTGSCDLQPPVPDHADFFRKYKYFRRHSAKRCCRGPQKPSDEHCFQPG